LRARPRLQKRLGEGGERLHEWLYWLESIRRHHGMSGGTSNADSEVLEETRVIQSPSVTHLGYRVVR
jgi:hypothetical protein